MLNAYNIKINNKIINVKNAIDFVNISENGAISIFIGNVRNYKDNKEVVGIHYDVLYSLAIINFKNICKDILNIYRTEKLKIYIKHRCGYVKVNESSIIIAISSPHRQLAFTLNKLILEKIKSSTPIWKQEFYLNGKNAWVESLNKLN